MSANGDRQSVYSALFISRRELKRMLADNERVIARANRDELCLASAAATVLIGALFAAALIFSWKSYLPIYGLSAALSAAVFLISRFGFRRIPGYKSGLHLSYAFTLVLFAFSMALSFYTEPVGSMVCFVVILIVAPMLTIDRARNVIALYLIADAAFLAGVYFCIEGKSAVDCTLNCIAFTVAGFLLGRYTCMIRLRAIDAERRLGMLTRSDSLTGLGNRRKLFELLTIVDGETGLSGAIMIDIDHFKEYNDTFGHQAGDDCLARLGALFQGVAEKRGFEAFRYGGEEFIAVSADPAADAACTAQEIVDGVRGLGIAFPVMEAGVVTVSVGYASGAQGGYEEFISRADAALYKAKILGRNRAAGYDASVENRPAQERATSFRRGDRK